MPPSPLTISRAIAVNAVPILFSKKRIKSKRIAAEIHDDDSESAASSLASEPSGTQTIAVGIRMPDEVLGLSELDCEDEEYSSSSSVTRIASSASDNSEIHIGESISSSTISNGSKFKTESGNQGNEGGEDQEQLLLDEKYMKMASEVANSAFENAYPNPPVGAVLVNTACHTASSMGQILGTGSSSNYNQDAVCACLQDAGLEITPLQEWLVAWPGDRALRESLTSPSTTLYVTLEPTCDRKGHLFPPLTNLIVQSGIGRVVVGCIDPVPEMAGKGCSALHSAGVLVKLLPPGSEVQNTCFELIEIYRSLANSKLHTQARKHYSLFGRPLGFLHCSVVDSDNLEAFQRQGNAFGTKFGGKMLNFRNFGAYEIAPPPESIWVDDSEPLMDNNDLISVDFDDEDFQGDIFTSPMMPWYEQVNAVVATFPRPGNGPAGDRSLAGRLNGLKWLTTQGRLLPNGVERILVMDATDLKELPLTNDAFAKAYASIISSSALSPPLVDVESFWKGIDAVSGGSRKPTRVLLRRGAHAQARSAAEAAGVAAQAAAKAAFAAAEALETGDAALAAEAALEMERSAQSRTAYILSELKTLEQLRSQLEEFGVVVETVPGGEPVDVMRHLGERNGYQSVVWRAGCWSERGVKAILDGAFQWVSAHLAVDAVGGKFWQLMLAENAVQAACGPLSRVKVFADQEDISLEYCDNPDVDKDCNLSIEGRPVRHIRLDCRVALVDVSRPREIVIAKTKKIDRKIIEEAAPWFF